MLTERIHLAAEFERARRGYTSMIAADSIREFDKYRADYLQRGSSDGTLSFEEWEKVQKYQPTERDYRFAQRFIQLSDVDSDCEEPIARIRGALGIERDLIKNPTCGEAMWLKREAKLLLQKDISEEV